MREPLTYHCVHVLGLRAVANAGGFSSSGWLAERPRI